MNFTESVTARVTEEQAKELKALIEERGGEFDGSLPFSECNTLIQYSDHHRNFAFIYIGFEPSSTYSEFKALVIGEESKPVEQKVNQLTMEEQIRSNVEEAKSILAKIEEENKPRTWREHHYLKTETEYFQAVQKGTKKFELRFNDRDFKVGDMVYLEETVKGIYTGRKMNPFEIKYILKGGKYGLHDNYCIFSW